MRTIEARYEPLIETVGELRALLADLPDDLQIRFDDPDTGWEMRLRSAICESGYKNKPWVVIATETYRESPY